MNSDSNETTLIDEIDRLFVVYDKAKDYLNKILAGVDEQIDLWQHRRTIVVQQMKTSASFDFLLPKTQRINELSIEAVQALCRVDLLIEQILRIDPKSVAQSRSIPTSTSFSKRQLDANMLQPTTNPISSHIHHPVPSPLPNMTMSTRQSAYGDSSSNGKIAGQQSQTSFPMPVLRTQPQRPSSRPTISTTQERATFKPIEQQQSSIMSDSASRPTPIYPQNSPYPTTERATFPRPVMPSYGSQTPSSGHASPPVSTTFPTQMTSYNQPTSQAKVKVKMQRIRPGVVWQSARIDIIDSLSAFYVENLDNKIHSKYTNMFDELHTYYENLEERNLLQPLENLSIGDFGVAKYSEDNKWYRARLIMSQQDDQIRIVFIDFGNIETKFIQEFFPLYRSFAELPAQVVACTLAEAFPRAPSDNDTIWPTNVIDIFRDIVTKGEVSIHFINTEEGTDKWPLHFVHITVDNQTVTNILSLKQQIEPKTNRYIAEQLGDSLKHGEYILFNVPISTDEIAEQ